MQRFSNVSGNSTTIDKRAAVEATLIAHTEWSDRRIAEHCGVTHPTVAAVRSDLEAGGQVERLSTIKGRDDVEQPAHKKHRTGSIVNKKPVRKSG